MAQVTRETSGIEIRMDKRGRQVLYIDGKRFPSTAISVSSGSPLDRGVVTIETLSQFVTFVNYEEPLNEPQR